MKSWNDCCKNRKEGPTNKTDMVAGDVEEENEIQLEPEKYVDMFADSGDEGMEKESKAEETGAAVSDSDSETEKVVKQTTEDVDVDVANENPAVENEKEATIEMDKEVQEPVAVKPVEKDQFEKTLESLSNIRNKMENMSKEELEEALKTLPSLHYTSTEDGRTTPVHLRDIEIPLKPLTEFMHEKRALYKQVFRNVNKKEFKSMLPKYLRVSVF